MDLVIFQENGSGEAKIIGIGEYGRNLKISAIYSINECLPEFIDDPEIYISDSFSGDLVLNFLHHPDLADHLVRLCLDKGIPVIAAGKKISGAITPFTCCGLGKHRRLGDYGRQFGFPELEIEIRRNRISRVEVKRGASCGATWDAIPQILGLEIDEALVTYAREVQYLCQADPSAFDPVSGKSALHYAGEVHATALRKAFAGSRKK